MICWEMISQLVLRKLPTKGMLRIAAGAVEKLSPDTWSTQAVMSGV